MASTIEVDQVKHSGGVAFTLPTADGSAGQKLKTDGSGVLSFVSDTDSGITSLAADTTPQLGGDLDLNSNNITGTGNIPAANLTGTLPAISGANLTGISSGFKEYSRGAKNGAITINSTTPLDVGIRANLNPTSTSDIIRIQHFWSYADNTPGTAQKHELIKSLNGGSIASHLVWTDYINHWDQAAATNRSTSSLWWIGTAGDLGWSTGVLSLGVRVSLQNSNTWIYNEGFGLSANGATKQMSFIEAFRYSSSVYTAGTDA